MEYREYLEDYVLNELSDNELLPIYNELLDKLGYCDSRIFDNDEEFLNGMFSNPNDAVAAVCYGNYKYTDEFVKFDGYGNLKSSNYLTDLVDKYTFLDLLEDAEYNINEYKEIECEEC